MKSGILSGIGFGLFGAAYVFLSRFFFSMLGGFVLTSTNTGWITTGALKGLLYLLPRATTDGPAGSRESLKMRLNCFRWQSHHTSLSVAESQVRRACEMISL